MIRKSALLLGLRTRHRHHWWYKLTRVVGVQNPTDVTLGDVHGFLVTRNDNLSISSFPHRLVNTHLSTAALHNLLDYPALASNQQPHAVCRAVKYLATEPGAACCCMGAERTAPLLPLTCHQHWCRLHQFSHESDGGGNSFFRSTDKELASLIVGDILVDPHACTALCLNLFNARAGPSNDPSNHSGQNTHDFGVLHVSHCLGFNIRAILIFAVGIR